MVHITIDDKHMRCLRNPLSTIVAAAAIVALLKLTLLDIYSVEGTSMEPDLRKGQVIFVNRWNYGLQIPIWNTYIIKWNQIKRGDVVVYSNPLTGTNVVKRCYGIPGDSMLLQDMMLTIGDFSIPISQSQETHVRDIGEIPDGFIFAAGDNTGISVDSRDYGLIPVNALRGRVIHASGSST